MKKIPLTRGLFALVDDGDYDWLAQWKWYSAECRNGVTYARRHISDESGMRRELSMHREIMGLSGKSPFVDHRNRNGLDNRKSNLRICSRSQNRINAAPTLGGTSKYKGVSHHGQMDKWSARLVVNGKNLYLGVYTSQREAAIAYDLSAISYYGDFAYLNFPKISNQIYKDKVVSNGR